MIVMNSHEKCGHCQQAYELEYGVIDLVFIKSANMRSILLLVLKTWQEDLGASMGGQTFCDYSLKDW